MAEATVADAARDASATPARLRVRDRVRMRLGWWQGLSAWGRVSLVGVAAAALLAVGLGLYIPRQVEQHMLEAEVDSAQRVLDAVLETSTLPADEPADFTALDGFVDRAIAKDHLVRVKLWSSDGTILYSDEPRLIGQRFQPEDGLAAAFGGRASYELSTLSAPENRFERSADRLLEIYLPVDDRGELVAAWEVYQSVERFDEELADVRRAVWISVGGGLTVLLVFLASTFGNLFAAVQRRRVEAERLNAGLEAAQRERRELTARLVSAHEEERREIVGEIHDGLGQDLHRVLFGLRGCEAGPPTEVAAEMSRLEEIVDASTRRLRRLLEGVRPATLEDVGLTASLRGLVDRARVDEELDVKFEASGSMREPPPHVRVAVFRIAQEALRNVARHSGNKRALMELCEEAGDVVLRVADRGIGLSPNGRTGLGTWLMRERAEALGGTLSLSSDPSGTTVVARVPIGDGAG